MTKKERILKNIEVLTERIEALQAKRDSLLAQKKEIENTEILEAVNSVQVTPEQLKQVLSNIKSGSKIPIKSMDESKED